MFWLACRSWPYEQQLAYDILAGWGFSTGVSYISVFIKHQKKKIQGCKISRLRRPWHPPARKLRVQRSIFLLYTVLLNVLKKVTHHFFALFLTFLPLTIKYGETQCSWKWHKVVLGAIFSILWSQCMLLLNHILELSLRRQKCTSTDWMYRVSHN